MRYVPAAFARQMIDAGSAEIASQNGRVKSVRLLETASTSARMIGPPTGNVLGGVRFSAKERLDNGFVVWRHLARSTDYE